MQKIDHVKIKGYQGKCKYNILFHFLKISKGEKLRNQGKHKEENFDIK